jgi:S-DNA-T family DNA segregation ATPase FtsK/SpoIIIE
MPAAIEKGRLNREIWGVVIALTALLIAISLVSYSVNDRSFNTPSGAVNTHNWGGFLGAFLADLLLQGLGLSSYLVPVFLTAGAVQMFRASYEGISLTRTSAYAVLLVSVGVLLSVIIDSESARDAGGIVGGFLKESILIPLFGRLSSVLIACFMLLLSIMMLTQHSLLDLIGHSKRSFGEFKKSLLPAINDRVKELREKNDKRKGENTKKEKKDYTPPAILTKNDPIDDLVIKKQPAKKTVAPAPEQFKLPEVGEGYKLPPLELLDPPEHEQISIDKETLHANSLILQKKLEDFGVEGEVVAVRPGPVITMYEFKPAPGVKVRRIVMLADDLAMALRAVSVRILAPIPGESVVGIEIPNPRREIVYLREVIESDSYRIADSKITLALGKDIGGVPFTTDLSRMPHLLVAGATGTGKSVSINAMILSLLFKSNPQDVKFIMVDPKMLELTVYEDIPHQLVPVVTDPKKAAAALFWAMDEMDRRYRLMREKGVRNIDGYNRAIEKDSANKKDLIQLIDEEPMEETPAIGGRLSKDAPLIHGHLPRIVIIIDELADLMMTVGRDIEEYITRLAQKARAAGIHLILATQRPSVDVITGLIKANFPARISFQVTSRIDSRTILDSMGGEKLLGNGDMLFLPPGTARLTRIHGAFVSDQEVRKVVKFIKQQGRPNYRTDILEAKKEIEAAAAADEEYDEMYDQAVAIVTETQQASISMIQRRLRVGYNRAARMIEVMERDGVIGPADGAKPREVYAQKIEED